MFECKECYKEASEQVKGLANPEEVGHLLYDFLHYEFNHGNAERMGLN